MNENDVLLQIRAVLEKTSWKTVNDQLEELKKKYEKSGITIKISDETAKVLQDFGKSMDKVNNILKEQRRTVEQTQEVFKNLDGSVKTITQSVDAMGEVVTKTRIVHDANKKAMQDETTVAQKLTEAVQNQNKANFDAVTILKNKANATSGYNVKSSQGYTVTSTNYQADGQTLKSASVTTNYKKQRDDELKAQEDYIKQTRANMLQEERELQDFVNKTKKEYDNKLSNLENFKTKYLQIIEQMQARSKGNINSDALGSVGANIKSLDINSPNLSTQMKEIPNQLKLIGIEAQNANTHVKGFNDRLLDAVKTIPVWMSIHAGISVITHGIRDAFQIITDVDARMAAYVQTNEQVLNSQQKVDEEAHKFIQTAHDLGASINDVLESARLYGRMYKDVGVTQELVRQSTKLSTVDLVSLGDATKGMEAILSQYHIQLKNVNEAQVVGNNLLDKFSNVSHQSAIPARDLVAAYERMGSAAYQTGVSVDFMNGLLASGFRNTALSGENLGNMWKTVLGNIHSDKAVAELDRLGVKTKEVVNGVTQWKSAEDVLLELSTKVIGKNEDLTKSYEDIARGVYQYQKLAASIDLGSIIQGQAASINSVGSTTKYLETRLETIEVKAKQVHASFVELFTGAGDNGLRNTIKDILDITDQFIIGSSKVPTSIYAVTGAISMLAAGYITLNKPIGTVIEAFKVMTGIKAANTVATAANTVATTANSVATDINIVSSKGSTLATVSKTVSTEAATVATSALTAAEAASAVTVAAATMGISLLVGGLAAFIFSAGSAAKAQEDLTAKHEAEISILEQKYTQIEKQIEVVPKWINVYFELNKAIENGTVHTEDQTKAKSDLDKVSKALIDTVGQDGLAQIQAAKTTDEATKLIIESLNKRRIAARQDIADRINLESQDLHDQRFSLLQKRNTANQQIDSLKSQGRSAGDDFGLVQSGAIKIQENIVKQAEADLKKIDDKLPELVLKKSDIDAQLMSLSLLNGDSNKNIVQDEATLKANFDEQMATFRHNVNMQVDGYKDAAQQADKLNAIKSQFSGKLKDADLYSIDEEIHRANNDIALNAKGFSSGNSTVMPYDQTTKAEVINPYARKNRELDGQLSESEAIQIKYKNTQQQFRDESLKQIDVYKQKQDLSHQEAEDIRTENGELQKRLITEKLTQAQRNSLLRQLNDNETKISQLSKAWLDYDKTIEGLKSKNSTSLVDESIKGLSENTKDFETKIKTLKTAMDSLKTDPAGKVADQNAIIDTFQQEQQQILANIQALKDLSSTLDVNSDAWNKAQDEIKKYQDQSAQVEADSYALKQKIAQDTVDLMKKAYQAEKQAQLDALDTEKKAFDDATQAKIDSIDRLRSAQDYQYNLDKDQDKAQKIQNEINALQPDTSNEARSKIIDLKQQLADQQEKIDKEQRDNSDKLVKQDLQDKQKAYDQDIQNHKDSTTTKYDNLINDDQKWLAVEKDIINGHVQGIQTEMTGLIDSLGKYANDGMTSAKNNASQLLSLVSQVKKASANLGGYSETVNSPTAQSNSSTSGSSTDDVSWQDKLKRAEIDDAYAMSEITRAKSVYNADMATGNVTGAQAAHTWADQIRQANPRVGSNPLYMNTGGYTGNSEGLAYLHSKEIVLDKFDTSNLLKVVDFTRDIMSKIKTPDFSNIISKPAMAGGNNFNVNLGGITITGDQKGANSALDTIVNGLKRMGVNINKV